MLDPEHSKMFLFQIPDTFPRQLIGEYLKDPSPDRFLFRQCKPVETNSQTPHIRFSVSTKELQSLDVLPNSSLLPLVTERAGELLKSACAGDIELVPAIVETFDGSLNGCSILNVLTKISGIDLSLSEISYVPGTQHIMKVSKLVCIENAIKGHCLARDSNYMGYVWASDHLKALFGASGIQGVQFASPSSVHP